MSKEIAQTVGGKRIAWLLAIIAAFAVMATLTTQWRSSSAALPTTAVTVTQSTTSTVGGGAVAWTATFAFTPSGTQLATAGVNFALDFDDDLVFVSVTGAGTLANVSGGCANAAGNVVSCTATAAAYTNGTLIFNFTNPQAGAVIDGPANGLSATVCMSDVTTVACTLPAGYTATNAVTVTPLTATNLLGDAETYTFALPIGYTCDSDNTVDSLRSCAAGDVNLGAGLTLVSGPTVAAASTAVATTVTVTVVNTNAASTGGTISLDVSATENGTGFISQEATKVYVAGELRHMADLAAPTGTISVIARRDVESNVRNSRHTICTFQQDTAIDLNNNGLYTDSGDVAPVAVQLPGLTLANLVVTNGGGYASTIDTDPTFSDVRIFVGDGTDTGLLTSTTTAGFLGATCVSWVSLDAGDQSLSIVYVGDDDGANYSVHWDTNGDANDNDGMLNDGTPNTTLVKEWNRLEDSELGLAGGATGTAAGNSTTVPVISRTVSLTLNPATGLYQATPVAIVDVFRGSHTNSAGQLEGPMALTGVNWTIARAAGYSTCGTLTAVAAGVTQINSAAQVVGNPAAIFSSVGCAPGQVVRIVFTGSEPGPLGSGTGIVVTEIVELTFSATIASKQVFLAWAGQRIILEHDWRVPAGDTFLGSPNGPVNNGDTAVAGDYCPFPTDFTVTYVKGSGPGNFLPGLGASVANLADTASVVVDDDDSQSFVADLDIPGDANGSCISRVLYESEDQGQVDIEAFVTGGDFQTQEGFGGLAYTKHAFVIYYMKINTVNVSLATQFSKPSHNSSFVGYRDWANTSDTTKAPTNPWDASKDDADNAAEWNVSKDLLVRGRVTGWFTTTNPSGRARDDSNPLNVLPADRWVMPNDWALLAGGPADNADGSAAKGTAEQFRPYFDIMTSPNNPIYALSDPTGSGYAYAGYVTYTYSTTVAAGNTGNGTAANPISVVDCTYLVAGLGITFSDATTTTRTVASCSSGELVLTVARDTAPASAVGVRANLTGLGSAAYPLPVSSCTFLAPGTVVRTLATAMGVVSTCAGNLLVVSAPLSSVTLAKSGTILLAPSAVPFEGPYSLVDIPGLAPLYGGAALSNYAPGNIRDTIIQDGDVNMWDAPMPPAMASVAIRDTGTIKQVYKDEVYYSGTPNTASIEAGGTQMYPNPFYMVNIPDSMWIPAISVGGGYLWDSWSYDGPGGLGQGVYWFWTPARIGVNSAGIADSTLTAVDSLELAIIRMEQNDPTIARDLVVYSDNHGEFMVAANGDFKTDLTACATNVLGGGKHCKSGDKVGTGTITATVDYPDFRGKHFPVLSNTAKVTWLWGGYKDVTIEKGETDQYKYIVFHGMDRDGFCSPLTTGAILLHSVLTYEDAYDQFTVANLGGSNALSAGGRYYNDPDENVDFWIDGGEGIIVDQSGGGAINDGKHFATGVTTFSVEENDPATSGIKEFPLSSLAGSTQKDECQAWVKVSNSLLGIVDFRVIAHDDEGDIGFDRVVDLMNTMSYTLNFRWSLITWAGADAIPVADALKGTGTSGKNPGGNDISASVTAIYGWNAAAQQWLGYFPSGVNVPGANDLTGLNEGDAYWIAITGPSSVTWTIATNVN